MHMWINYISAGEGVLLAAIYLSQQNENVSFGQSRNVLLGYPLDSGRRCGSALVGLTIAFCRLSTPERFLCQTDHKKNKKRWSVPPWTAATYLSQADSPSPQYSDRQYSDRQRCPTRPKNGALGQRSRSLYHPVPSLGQLDRLETDASD